MENEFTKEEINRDTCSECQCKNCTSSHCEVPCRSKIPCTTPVTKCGWINDNEEVKIWVTKYCKTHLSNLRIIREGLIQEMINLRNDMNDGNSQETIHAIKTTDNKKIEIDGSIKALKALAFCTI